MKLDYVNESSVVGNFETNSFGVKVSSKMFKIFSSNIYKYPVRAVIREYCCNARDSHIDAKTSEKYELHLPTKIDPVFYVRDYGTGLSYNDVMTTFTQYFYSTKESSNDYVGCLGLGSKSLYSIVDSFVVTSWYNGQKSTYTCYMDENGEPKIAHISTVDSSEKNGLKVEASVKNEDIYKFEEELGFVFMFMDKPICNKPIPHRSKLDFENDNYAIGLNKTTSYVVMGGVSYTVDSNQITDPSLKAIVNHGIILHAKMGKVSFNPGREELSYDKKTIEWLTSTLSFVKSDIEKQIQSKVDAFNSYFQARKYVNSLSSIWNSIGNKLSYQGKGLNSLVKTTEEMLYKVQGKVSKYRKVSVPNYTVLSKYILVNKDQMTACKEYAKNFREETVFFINQDQIKEIGLCDKDYISGDTIRVVTKRQKGVYVKKKISGYKFNDDFRSRVSKCYTSESDIPEGSVYIIFDRKYYTNDVAAHYILVNIYNALKSLFGLKDLYCVKSPIENGVHLKEWIKTANQKFLLRNPKNKFQSYLLKSDEEYKKHFNKAGEKPTGFDSFPKEIKDCIKYDKFLVQKEQELKEKMPIIEYVGFGNELESNTFKMIKELMDALPH